MFFGTFLDGPLAGSTFEFTEADSGGGFGIGPLFGIGIVLSVLLIVVVGPFIIWPIFVKEVSAGQSMLWSGVIIVPQVIYIVCRIRSCVRHWKTNFIKELLLNMLFLFIAIFAAAFIIGMIMIDAQTKSLIAQYFPELMEQFVRNMFASTLSWLFVLALLSGIPTAITCLVSSSICKKIARKTNVRY